MKSSLFRLMLCVGFLCVFVLWIPFNPASAFEGDTSTLIETQVKVLDTMIWWVCPLLLLFFCVYSFFLRREKLRLLCGVLSLFGVLWTCLYLFLMP